MSHFYAEIQGSRGRASRCGTKGGGIWSHVRGWDIWVKVYCDVDEEGRDRLMVFKTGGSNAPGPIGNPIAVVVGD